ncbi:TraU family protein [Photobacterium damselae]|uniref:TraU family protein n=1 Tax=Photobacterium damselae TaxID=38293 RepID=UPI004067841C
MLRTKKFIGFLALIGITSISFQSVAGGVFGEKVHHNHYEHNNDKKPTYNDYNDQQKYSDLNQFLHRGNNALDQQVASDNAGLKIANQKGGVKSSLMDDWKAGYDFSCIDFKIVGSCSWLHIGFWGASVRMSPLVSHYSPDAIVEVFHNVNNEPTVYGRLTTHVAKGLANSVWSNAMFGGFKLENNDSRGEGFHEVQVIGNPLITLHDQTIGSIFSALGGYCDSGAIPMYPYLHSLNDPEWRAGILETAASAYGQAANFFSDEKFYVRDHSTAATSMWGNIYPRTGVTENPSPFIGASIAALRAGILVTTRDHFGASWSKGLEGSGLHVIPKKMTAYSNNNVKSYTDQTVTMDRGHWKVLLPKTYKGAQCTTMPFAGISTNTGVNEPESESRNYVFQLWRKYKCCKRKGQYFLGKIQW